MRCLQRRLEASFRARESFAAAYRISSVMSYTIGLNRELRRAERMQRIARGKSPWEKQ